MGLGSLAFLHPLRLSSEPLPKEEENITMLS